MTRDENISLIGTNIKTNSNRVSPTKTTGPMLREVLLGLAGQLPYSDVYDRTNSASGLSDAEYISNFLTDPVAYNYTDVGNQRYLDGANGNFFMDIFREIALRLNQSNDIAFDREAKFIVGRQLSNTDLEGSNWFVADGTNGTDDMRGRYIVGGGRITSGGRTETIPYLDNVSTPNKGSKVGQHRVALTPSNIPAHDHDIEFQQCNNDWDSDNSNIGLQRPGAPARHKRADHTMKTSKYGSSTPTSIENRPASITGTWIQYVKPDVDPPTTPTNLTSSNITGSSFRVSWGASTDDTGIRGYEVFVNGVKYGSFTTTNYMFITGRTPDTSYQVKVRALDVYNKVSSFTPEITVTTLDVDVTAPTIPSNLLAALNMAGSSTQFTVTLSWDRSSDNVEVANYIVERRPSGGGLWELHGQVPQVASNINRVTFTPPNIYTSTTTARSYDFRVRAVDTANNYSTYSNVDSVTIPADFSGGGGGPISFDS